MNKLTILQESNYLAKVVRLQNPRTHSNADRLLCWNIDFYNVITSLEYSEGDLCVYFPEGCQIDHTLLKTLNLFSDSQLNIDNTKKGFFNSKGVVKTQKLRDEKSEGFLLKIEILNNYFSNLQIDWQENTLFDSIDYNYVLCKKYVPEQIIKNQNQSRERNIKSSNFDCLIPGQFVLHKETPHLEKNFHKIDQDKDCIITYKVYGSSCILSHVRTKKRLNFFEKFLSKFVKIEKTQYDYIWSSGKPKSGKPKGILSVSNLKNKKSIWDRCFEDFKHTLEPGITLYGELVGNNIQGQFDYAHLWNKNGYGFLVYRITRTNDLGYCDEFSWEQIVDYCFKYNLSTVPLYHIGKIEKQSISHLQEQLTPKSLFCANNVPEEGFVIRQGNNLYKLVSFHYKLKDVEDIQES